MAQRDLSTVTPSDPHSNAMLHRACTPHCPYAFGLSAYSTVLTSFGGGDGEVGLHGTNDPSILGSDVSHGCIRVSNSVITRLSSVCCRSERRLKITRS